MTGFPEESNGYEYGHQHCDDDLFNVVGFSLFFLLTAPRGTCLGNTLLANHNHFRWGEEKKEREMIRVRMVSGKRKGRSSAFALSPSSRLSFFTAIIAMMMIVKQHRSCGVRNRVRGGASLPPKATVASCRRKSALEIIRQSTASAHSIRAMSTTGSSVSSDFHQRFSNLKSLYIFSRCRSLLDPLTSTTVSSRY